MTDQRWIPGDYRFRKAGQLTRTETSEGREPVGESLARLARDARIAQRAEDYALNIFGTLKRVTELLELSCPGLIVAEHARKMIKEIEGDDA